MPDDPQATIDDQQQRFFNVTYRTDGEDGTVGQLAGPSYNQSLVGIFGTFANVPEGDGYILTVQYGSATLSRNLNVHSDMDETFRFFGAASPDTGTGLGSDIQQPDPTQISGFDPGGDVAQPPDSAQVSGFDPASTISDPAQQPDLQPDPA